VNFARRDGELLPARRFYATTMATVSRRESGNSTTPDYDIKRDGAAGYLACASSLHAQADRARFPEAKESLDRVARWYEVLARYVARRGPPLAL
jgi:hypothetical protein